MNYEPKECIAFDIKHYDSHKIEKDGYITIPVTGNYLIFYTEIKFEKRHMTAGDRVKCCRLIGEHCGIFYKGIKTP